MHLFTYRWHFSTFTMDSIAGVTAGANARDALTRAMTERLSDGRPVGGVLEVPVAILEMAPECHIPELAFRFEHALVSMVRLHPTEEYTSEVLRDHRSHEFG